MVVIAPYLIIKHILSTNDELFLFDFPETEKQICSIAYFDLELSIAWFSNCVIQNLWTLFCYSSKIVVQRAYRKKKEFLIGKEGQTLTKNVQFINKICSEYFFPPSETFTFNSIKLLI